MSRGQWIAGVRDGTTSYPRCARSGRARRSQDLKAKRRHENRTIRPCRRSRTAGFGGVRRAAPVRGRRGCRRLLLLACGRASRNAAQSCAGAERLPQCGRARHQDHAAWAPGLFAAALLAAAVDRGDLHARSFEPGRLDVGVGRGVSPYEVEFHNVMHAETRDIFVDAFECLSKGLSSETLTYESGRYSYKDVPIALRPLQQPHPPFWYASSSEVGSTWAGEHGLHYVTLGATAMAKANIEAFKNALAKRGAPAQLKPEFPGGVVIGVQRHIFVAETDAAAHRIFKPAMEAHLVNLNWLRVKKNDTGLTSRLKIPHGGSYEEMVEHGGVVAGSPQTVRAELERQTRKLGINYLLAYPFLGTMTLAEALGSLELFKSEVMPHLSKL